MEFDLLNVLGKEAASPEVRAVIKRYGLLDARRSPPNRIYQSSHKRGLSLVINSDRVTDIQIYLKPSKPYVAFTDPLPFGIRAGMIQKQVHQLLGKPTQSDEIDSRFEMLNFHAKLIVRYDDAMVVKFLNIGYAGAKP